MADKTTLECTKHGLRFEQFDDWADMKDSPVPQCYMCAHEQHMATRRELAEVTRQRDLLLGAIEVKLAVPVAADRRLRHD